MLVLLVKGSSQVRTVVGLSERRPQLRMHCPARRNQLFTSCVCTRTNAATIIFAVHP